MGVWRLWGEAENGIKRCLELKTVDCIGILKLASTPEWCQLSWT